MSTRKPATPATPAKPSHASGAIAVPTTSKMPTHAQTNSVLPASMHPVNPVPPVGLVSSTVSGAIHPVTNTVSGTIGTPAPATPTSPAPTTSTAATSAPTPATPAPIDYRDSQYYYDLANANNKLADTLNPLNEKLASLQAVDPNTGQTQYQAQLDALNRSNLHNIYASNAALMAHGALYSGQRDLNAYGLAQQYTQGFTNLNSTLGEAAIKALQKQMQDAQDSYNNSLPLYLQAAQARYTANPPVTATTDTGGAASGATGSTTAGSATTAGATTATANPHTTTGVTGTTGHTTTGSVSTGSPHTAMPLPVTGGHHSALLPTTVSGSIPHPSTLRPSGSFKPPRAPTPTGVPRR